MRGLVIGRFQPFHKGHQAAIREALTKCDDLIIVIGSAELSHTSDNPFTAGERYQMLISSFAEEERSRIHIIPVRDVNRYAAWVNHVESYVPPFDIVFSNSELTRSLFSAAGYESRKTKNYSSKQYSGTEIRRRIAAGEKWSHLVPSPVAQMIEGLDGRQRLLDSGMYTRRKSRGDGNAR